jgi:hypothetical protein
MNERVRARSNPESSRGVLAFLLIVTPLALGLFWNVPAQAQITDAKIAALVEALRLSAPNTGNPNDGLYSDWKIKWENIVRWSKRCTGTEMEPAEFEADTLKAREILGCVMGKVLREQYEVTKDELMAVRRAASWWMTGDPELYDAEQTRPYTQKVLDSYRRSL